MSRSLTPLGAVTASPLRHTAQWWLLVAPLALAGWAAASLLWSPGGLAATSAYLIAPPALLLGAVAGRWLRAHPLPTAALAVCLGLGTLLVPFYANAQAAVGVQLVALAGLLAPARQEPAGSEGTPEVPAPLAVGIGILGVLLAARSQAALTLAVVLAALTLLAVLGRRVPRPRVVGALGILAVGVAAGAVVLLGRLDRWPDVINSGSSLSRARHELWTDALSLWSAHPLLGAGPGAFFEFSQTAQSAPHLYAAHSSILQVGSELGLVGAVLFSGVLLAAVAVASHGAPPRALIGIAAWSALGIHSMIDHLYEYPVVTALAGVVLGQVGRRARERPTPSARLPDRPEKPVP